MDVKRRVWMGKRRTWVAAVGAAIILPTLLLLILASSAGAAMMETRSFSVTGLRVPLRNVVSGTITVNSYPEWGYDRIDVQIDGINM